MRILFLSSVFPHVSAPVRGTFNLELCEALAGYADVRVVSPRSWVESVRRPRRLVSSEHVSSVRTCWPTYFYLPRMTRAHYGACMWHSIRRQVRKWTSEFQPDWVLSYWAHPDGEAGLRAARDCGAKAGVIIGGSDVLILTSNNERRARIEQVLRESDAVLPISDGLRSRVLELGADEDRVRTLPQGINPAHFNHGFKALARRRLKIPVTRRVFLWVGRMVGVKRLDLLISAFQKLLAAEPDAQLVMAGGGPLKRSVQDSVAERGLGERVLFPGQVEQSQLGDWYRAADAVVLASDSEGIPNVLRECLACGTPFVSTDVGSIREIADDAHSILTPPGDTDGLSHALREILDERFMIGAQRHELRTWDDSARDCVRMLEELSAGRDQPHGTSGKELVGAGQVLVQRGDQN